MGEVRYAEIGSLVFDCPADGGGDAFECIDHGVALYTEASSFEIDAWSDVGAFSGIIEPDWRTEVTECGGGGCAIASERIQLEGA